MFAQLSIEVAALHFDPGLASSDHVPVLADGVVERLCL
jgi:hypothetical protein